MDKPQLTKYLLIQVWGGIVRRLPLSPLLATSLGKTVSLSLLHFVLQGPNLLVTPCISSTYFYIPVPCDEKDIIFGVLEGLEGLVVFTEPFNFSFFCISGRGINLDYHDIEWFALETNRSFCHF